MKSPKEDYEIRKRVVSDLGTGEDLLNFLSFYTLVLNMYKCTSKVVTPDNKRTMAENTASWSETAQELDEDDNLKLNFFSTSLLFLRPTISYSWS